MIKTTSIHSKRRSFEHLRNIWYLKSFVYPIIEKHLFKAKSEKLEASSEVEETSKKLNKRSKFIDLRPRDVLAKHLYSFAKY